MEPADGIRNKVNGKFLSEFTGKPVSILGRVIKVASNGSSLEMKSTDNMVINVILKEPVNVSVDGWVDVRGVGQGKCHVIAQQVIIIEQDVTKKFDADLYDDMICVINSCPNPWVNT